MYNLIEKTIELPDGKKIIIETGKLAKQADGSVVVKMDKTMLLATVVSAQEGKPDVDFMPLTVEYKEKFASSGRFPGGFLKREGRPGNNEILTSRLVDRVLRPLFPEDYHAETFMTIELISADKNVMPDSLAGLAASAALAVSDIPFNGPISEVRVCRINGEFKINPTFSELEESDLDIMVGATKENILMVEGEMNEIAEVDMIQAIKFGHEAIKVQCQVQIELMEMVGKTKKREYCHEENDEELRNKVQNETYDKIYAVAKQLIKNKQERAEAFNSVKQEFIDSFPEDEEINTGLVDKYFHDVEKKAIRDLVLNEKIRIDGRKCDEIRPIWCEVDCLPAAHGSAIFTRGETQSLSSVTLGTKLDEKIVDEVLRQGRDKFLLHYSFLPYSTGDARPYRGVSRREVGHGNLAHRALKIVMPNSEENPYSIRLVSDILESNGSSSMATVCAGTLALMDAGIKIKKPVSGIAMGLITDNSGKFAVLSDILGDEDHLGDMDFKVTGTKDGITATQMDIKVDGLPYEVLEQALEQARIGRLHILNKITETLSEPREDLKPHAPRILKLTIAKEFIGAIIGPGGSVIQDIQKTTGTTIVIEEVDELGIINIVADNKESIDAAAKIINSITEVPEIGKVYKGKIKSIVSFGAFVEILPKKEGLLHISEIEWRRIIAVEDILKEGQEIEVKLLDIDRSGKLKLSRKVLLPKPERKEN
ncbi:MAG: polyribonucleotide nucleotidyltransferase [Bacteroidales bacterium]|nr:polyribonucleotide nucleotidyltransferase [Bacteroidales bacterium]